jgi:hypothetical protein
MKPIYRYENASPLLSEISIPSVVMLMLFGAKMLNINYSDYFTDYLFVLEQDALPGAKKAKGSESLIYNGKPVTPIIPLKPEILRYVRADDLFKNISFKQNEDNSISVDLIVPLRNAEFKPKTYALGNISVISGNYPLIEIWPNFVSEKWKLYYVYTSLTRSSRVGRDLIIRPYILDNRESEKQTIGQDFEITKMRSFPDVMSCSFDKDEIGIIFIDKPLPLGLFPGHKWGIGIDFGNKDTCIYACIESKMPFSVKFEDRLLQVTNSLSSERSILVDHFIPPTTLDSLIPNTFHDFNVGSRFNIRPLLDGNISFFSSNTPEKAANLKWSDDPKTRMRIKPFLAQIYIQCSAEAVVGMTRSVEWKFSYPSHLTNLDQVAIKDLWNQITNEYSSLTGLNNLNSFEQRCKAIARFLSVSPQRASMAVGTVCVDIGENSSDISVWQTNKLIWYSSLNFGGKHIFLEFLAMNLDFLGMFGVDYNTINELKSIENDDDLYFRLSHVVAFGSDNWLKNLEPIKENDNFKKFQQFIAIECAGLFYYIGGLLKHLHESKRYNLQMPSIYLTGNGGRILHWLAADGKHHRIKPINNLFKKMIIEASGFKATLNPFNIEVSHKPKHETAEGLVCNGAILVCDENIVAKNIMLSGEAFFVGEREYHWDEAITIKQLRELRPKDNLECFEHFIKVFNDFAQSSPDLVLPIDTNWELIRENLSLALGKYKNSYDINNLPLFIIELKALLKAITDEWVSENNQEN